MECQRGILDRLHWRDLLSVSQCSRALQAVAFDEVSWRKRCLGRFALLSCSAPSRSRPWTSTAVRTPTSSPTPITGGPCSAARCVAPGTACARPPPPRHPRQPAHALPEVRGGAGAHRSHLAACVREFIFGRVLLHPPYPRGSRRASPAPPSPTPHSRRSSKRSATSGRRGVRLQVWYLGRLDGRALFNSETTPTCTRDRWTISRGTRRGIWRRLRDGIKKRRVRHGGGECRSRGVKRFGPDGGAPVAGCRSGVLRGVRTESRRSRGASLGRVAGGCE